MKIVIVGAGTVGFSLAEHLSKHNHRISVIDLSPSRCEELGRRLDVFAVVGGATDPEVLESAGIAKADMVIAVTPYNDTNLVVCNFAKQFGVPKRIARVRSTRHSEGGSAVSLEELGVTHVIKPEKELVSQIVQYVELPDVTVTANFQSDSVYLRGYRITEDMPVANRTLAELSELTQASRVLIVLIIRNGRSVMPSGSERILPGDEIIAIMLKDSLPAFRVMVNRPSGKKLKKIIVSGDSLTTIRLAEELGRYAERVIMVDPDAEHAREAASLLDRVEVLHGDCTSEQVLQEIQVGNASFFVAAGEDSEDNIMSCLLAKAEGAREVTAVSTSLRHVDLFRSLGLDHVVSPYEITSQTIIANILRVSIGALLTLRNVDAEVMNFVAGRDSQIVGKPLGHLDTLFKKSIVICSVSRDNQVIIPSGETVIEENDEVHVLFQSANEGLVRRLFKPGRRFGQ